MKDYCKGQTASLLTTEQAANYLGLTRRALEAMRWRKIGPAFVKLGRLVRYRIADLDNYIEARVQEPILR